MIKAKLRNKILTTIITSILVCSTFLYIQPASATETFDWSKPRPSKDRDFCDTIGNASTDEISSLGLGVEIFKYYESPSPNDNDFLRFKVSVSANSRGWIEYYWGWPLHGYYWIEATQPANITGDNDGTWLQLRDTLLFYGVEYDKIWVCSNGFICLNKTYTNPSPQSIPNKQEPNPVIAVFWRDLHPENGGSITYEENIEFDVGSYFVVSWNNVPDSEGNPQTFQVLICNRCGWGATDYHNTIYFQYKNITKNCPTSIGIEDQLGDRGESLDLNDVHNELCRSLYVPTAGYRLEQLTIKLTKSDTDTNAKIDFIPTYIGGYNVRLENPTHPCGPYFEGTIDIGTTILLAIYEPWIGAAAATFWGCLLVAGQSAAELLSMALSPPFYDEIHNAGPQENEAYIRATCVPENQSEIYCRAFDSTLATTVEWSLLDPNNIGHSLTVTAEAMYYSRFDSTIGYVSTSVTLNMYTGAHYLDINTCRIGGYEISNIKIWADGNDYYSPETIIVTEGTHTIKVESSFWRYPLLYTFLRWQDQIQSNPRIINLDEDKSYTAYYNMTYVGTCPTLFAWNGSDYAYEALLNIHAESDITLQHQIQQTLVKSGLFYKLQLQELDNFTSHIDQVKLYAIDQNGKWHICPLITAKLNNTDITLKLLFDDDKRIDLLPAETINLKFLPSIPQSQTAYFIFEINGYNRKWPGE
jgi:hypothetical protein